MRLRDLWFIFSFVLLVGCATKQKTLVGNTARPVIKIDTTKINVDSVLIPSISDTFAENTTLIIPDINSPEDKVRAMMREGVNKNTDWSEAIHYDVRKPNYVIIHHTAQRSINQTIRTFQLEHTEVSAHYVIGRDGRIVQMLNDYLRSWHAGRSKWGTITDMNSVSLGIELDNNGREAFPEAQIQSLITLLDTLKTRYRIPFTNIIGHADIAPTRKDDPSVFFPWKRLAERGFGVWYDERNLQPVPSDFNYVDALRIIGYDVSNLNATIRAFKRKFIPQDPSETLSEYDKRVLYNLYRRYF